MACLSTDLTFDGNLVCCTVLRSRGEQRAEGERVLSGGHPQHRGRRGPVTAPGRTFGDQGNSHPVYFRLVTLL